MYSYFMNIYVFILYFYIRKNIYAKMILDLLRPGAG